MKTQTKSKMCKIVCLCLAMLIMASCFIPVVGSAAETFTPFYITGEHSDKFTITTNREEIFDISNASPGDTIKGEVVIKNNNKDKMEVAITDITTNIADRTLYENLDLKITHNGAVLYSGKYGSTPEPATNFIPIEGKKEIVFNVEVSFPEYSDNTYQGKEMDATWVFEAKYYGKTAKTDNENTVKKEQVKTGVDLTSYNSNNKLIPVFIGLSAGLIIVSFILILVIKRKEKNSEKEQE